MATKGLKYPVYAKYTETAGVPSYSDGAVVGSGMTTSIQYSRANVKLYGDDAQVDGDQSVLGGTITVGIYGMTLDTRGALLGHTKATAPAVGFTGAGTDEAPWVGFGFYGIKSGGTWRAFWLHKVQFAEPNDELETKGANTVFKTPTLTGEFTLDVNGDWGEIQEFDTEAAAIAWLNTNADISTGD